MTNLRNMTTIPSILKTLNKMIEETLYWLETSQFPQKFLFVDLLFYHLSKQGPSSGLMIVQFAPL